MTKSSILKLKEALDMEDDESAIIVTTGLVVHSCADGVALGASLFFSMSLNHEELETSSKLGLIIFVAILMHKIPASIGLGTFLARCENKTNMLYHLLAFTLASPIATIATYVVLQIVLVNDIKYKIGLLLMFSSGTFLYVSTMHILPETYENKSSFG